MSAPRSPSRSFLQVGIADTLVTVSESGVVGVHSWLPHDRHGPRGFTLDVDPTIYNAKYVILHRLQTFTPRNITNKFDCLSANDSAIVFVLTSPAMYFYSFTFGNFSGYAERQYIILMYNLMWRVLMVLFLHRTRRKLSGPFHPSLPLSSHVFVVSHDAKFLFSGGYWDSSLRVYSLAKSKTVASVRRHFGE